LTLCRHDIIDIKDGVVWVNQRMNIARKYYGNVLDVNIGFELAAFILPSDLVWTTFLHRKQSNSFARNIYYQCQNPLDVNRREATINYLRDRSPRYRSVVWYRRVMLAESGNQVILIIFCTLFFLISGTITGLQGLPIALITYCMNSQHRE